MDGRIISFGRELKEDLINDLERCGIASHGQNIDGTVFAVKSLGEKVTEDKGLCKGISDLVTVQETIKITKVEPVHDREGNRSLGAIGDDLNRTLLSLWIDEGDNE